MFTLVVSCDSHFHKSFLSKPVDEEDKEVKIPHCTARLPDTVGPSRCAPCDSLDVTCDSLPVSG